MFMRKGVKIIISFYKFYLFDGKRYFAHAKPIVDGIEFSDKKALFDHLQNSSKRFFEIVDTDGSKHLVSYSQLIRVEIHESSS